MTTPTTPTTDYTVADYRAEFDIIATDIAVRTTAAALGYHAAWQGGALTTPQWRYAFRQLLLMGTAVAGGLGDALAARVLRRLHGVAAQPVGVVAGTPDPRAEAARLDKAVLALVELADTAEDPRPRIERLARAEPVNAMQQAIVAAWDAHGIRGWRRGTDPDPCELCVWLVKAHLDPAGIGYVYPTSRKFHQHPGCRCIPVPVTE